jgi:hypothetical protein
MALYLLMLGMSPRAASRTNKTGHASRADAEVQELSAAAGEVPEDEVFARANAWMVDIARGIETRPHAVPESLYPDVYV